MESKVPKFLMSRDVVFNEQLFPLLQVNQPVGTKETNPLQV